MNIVCPFVKSMSPSIGIFGSDPEVIAGACRLLSAQNSVWFGEQCRIELTRLQIGFLCAPVIIRRLDPGFP